MLWTGLFLLAFVVFHILQFTTRTIQITPVIEGTVYLNLYEAFHEWYFVVLYVAAVTALGFHLWHAVWSATQTWGSDKPNRNPTIRRFSAGRRDRGHGRVRDRPARVHRRRLPRTPGGGGD